MSERVRKLKFCGRCGKELGRDTLKRFCPECRALNKQEQRERRRENYRAQQAERLAAAPPRLCVRCGADLSGRCGKTKYCRACAEIMNREMSNAWGRRKRAERAERARQLRAEKEAEPMKPKAEKTDRVKTLNQCMAEAEALGLGPDYGEYVARGLADRELKFTAPELERIRLDVGEERWGKIRRLLKRA